MVVKQRDFVSTMLQKQYKYYAILLLYKNIATTLSDDQKEIQTLAIIVLDKAYKLGSKANKSPFLNGEHIQDTV